MSNIIQLWMGNGKLVPFGARRDTWAATTHVLVEEVILKRWPYGEAFGYVYLNGEKQAPLDPKGAVSAAGVPVIACAGCDQWAFVELPGCPRGKLDPKPKRVRVLVSGAKIGFGAYRSRTIDDAIQLDPSWIKWAIQNVDYFAVEPVLLERLNPAATHTNRIGADLLEANRARVEAALKPRERA